MKKIIENSIKIINQFLLLKKIFLSLLLYLAVNSLLQVSFAAAPNPTIEQLRALERQIKTLQTQMHDTRTEYGKLQQQLQKSEENIGLVAQRLEVLHNELQDKQHTLEDLRAKQSKHHQQLTEQRRDLAKQIRAAYLMGSQDYLKLWLNQQDPAVVGRMLIYYDYFNRLRSEQIDKVKKTLQHIQTIEQEIVQENQRLNQLVAQQNQRKKQLEQNHIARKKILNRLAIKLKQQDKELRKLQEDKRELASLLGNLEETAKTLPRPKDEKPFWQLKGQLTYPVKGEVRKRFGQRRIGHLKWQGLLIDAKVGEKVRAVAAGRTVFAQWFRHLGMLVILDHGDGYMSLYGHNRSLYVKTGQWVEQNQSVASVGQSGGRDNPALYFEIRHQGNPLNPENWLF